MIKKGTFTSRLNDLALIIFMLILIAVMIIPFMNVLAISLSSPIDVSLGRVGLFPRGFTLDSYKVLIYDESIWRAYYNTIIYAAVGTFISILFSSMLAYSLTVRTYQLRKLILFALIVTMFFGGGFIPTYLVVKGLGMINTIWALVLPNAIGVFNIFIYRTFFLGVPESLRESAKIDGANDILILFKIYIPLSKPLLAVMALWGIVGQWNDFFNPLIFLTDTDKYPLQMILRRILNQFASSSTATRNFLELQRISPATVQTATIIFTSLPIICIYPFLQKYFTKGLLLGSIKG